MQRQENYFEFELWNIDIITLIHVVVLIYKIGQSKKETIYLWEPL